MKSAFSSRPASPSRLSVFSTTLCGALALLFLQGCSGGLDVQETRKKKELLSRTSVFENTASENTQDCVIPDGVPQGSAYECPTPTPTPVPQPTAAPEPPPPPPPVEPPAPSVDIPIDTMCSDMGSEITGFRVKTTPSLKIVITDDNLNPKCEIVDNGLRAKIINERKLEIQDVTAANCPNLSAGNYRMRLVPGSASASHPSGAIILGNVYRATDATLERSAHLGFRVKVESVTGGRFKVSSTEREQPHVSYDYNRTPNQVVGQTAECDTSASPLIIQLPKSGEAKPIKLSAPLDGIKFDILGERSFPRAHAKHQISWLVKESAQDNYFLVLPSKGSVKGINELFGDNTAGPDRHAKFAANGYEALRKWDGRKENGSFDLDLRDNAITPKDPVFSKLRLWADANVNGIAEDSELFTLDSKGIDKIDLNYDPNFEETDKYGNQVKMKSVARTVDGKLHLMYDIWFRLP